MDYIPIFRQQPQKLSPLTHSVYVNGSMPSQMGNINLFTRPVVKNEDGTSSTVRSITIGIGDEKNPYRTALIPTVHPDGYVMSNQEAIEWFKKSKQHLGIFDDEDKANTYAEKLHQQQQDFYSK